MKKVFFDCFSGISGNMILGALLDAGLSEEDLRGAITALPIDNYEIKISRVNKLGINAVYVDVISGENHPHRHLRHINDIILQSSLPEQVKEMSIKVFTNLAQVEAKVHGTTLEKVHFHEVGAVDAIIDIVGACYGFYKLGISEIIVSPLHVGSGMVKCAHGLMPIPAPATAELLRGMPFYSKEIKGELVTPTGAAIISTIASKTMEQPNFLIEAIAYGAGTWDLSIPNVVRMYMGVQEKVEFDTDVVRIIESNIDDMNPELFEYVCQKLFQAGALDVYMTPIYMKKGRIGILISVLSNLENNQPLLEIIFKETTTLGVRINCVERKKLTRKYQKINTELGEITIKIGMSQGQIMNVAPEYEDCKRIAQETGLPLKEIYQIALKEFSGM